MILDESTFYLYAAQHYDNPQCHSTDEFHDDLKRFQYLKRLLKRYKENGELRTRLILNHLIVLYNCFEAPQITSNMLFMKLEDFHDVLKPFVLFLSYLPDTIEYDNVKLRSSSIGIDVGVVEKLRTLKDDE